MRQRFTIRFDRDLIIIEGEQLHIDGEPTDRIAQWKVIEKPRNLSKSGAVKVVSNGLHTGKTKIEDIEPKKNPKGEVRYRPARALNPFAPRSRTEQAEDRRIRNVARRLARGESS